MCFIACSSDSTNNTISNSDTATIIENPEIKTQSAKIDPKDQNMVKMIFRYDGYRPGITSEWIQVGFSEGGEKIIGIWYWDSNNEVPQEIKILTQESSEGEISATYGTIIYGSSTDTASFSIIENTFRLFINEDEYQEFEQES